MSLLGALARRKVVEHDVVEALVEVKIGGRSGLHVDRAVHILVRTRGTDVPWVTEGQQRKSGREYKIDVCERLEVWMRMD